jgi:hypothetical protein
MAWVNEKAGDPSFASNLHMLAQPKASIHDPNVLHDLFSLNFLQRLPPQNEAYELVEEFFQKFNTAFPLFHKQTFISIFAKRYLQDEGEETTSSWWASINVVLAIAYRMRYFDNHTRQEDRQKSWSHLKNAMRAMNKLVMYHKDLLCVQALLGMVRSSLGNPKCPLKDS